VARWQPITKFAAASPVLRSEPDGAGTSFSVGTRRGHRRVPRCEDAGELIEEGVAGWLRLRTASGRLLPPTAVRGPASALLVGVADSGKCFTLALSAGARAR
jgi:hypothetical protein